MPPMILERSLYLTRQNEKMSPTLRKVMYVHFIDSLFDELALGRVIIQLRNHILISSPFFKQISKT